MSDEPEDSTDAPKVKLTKAERLEAKAARVRAAEERRAEGAAAGRPAASRGVLISLIVVSVVAAALIALTVLLYLSWQHQRDVNGARGKALAAAKTFAVDFGSYDYRHLDADFREVAARMTPDFAKSYVETSDKLKPTFVQYKTRVTAQIQGYGVTSVSTSKATVVVFLDQRVRTSQSGVPRVDRNRLEIHLVHEHGRWLVQKLLAK